MSIYKRPSTPLKYEYTITALLCQVDTNMACLRFGALLSVLLVTACAQVDNIDEYCVLKTGYNGMCVRYFNCDPKSSSMVLRADPSWKCSSYLDVCCPEKDILDLSSA